VSIRLRIGRGKGEKELQNHQGIRGRELGLVSRVAAATTKQWGKLFLTEKHGRQKKKKKKKKNPPREVSKGGADPRIKNEYRRAAIPDLGGKKGVKNSATEYRPCLERPGRRGKGRVQTMRKGGSNRIGNRKGEYGGGKASRGKRRYAFGFCVKVEQWG